MPYSNERPLIQLMNEAGEVEPIKGAHGSSRVLLYDAAGDPLFTVANPGSVNVLGSALPEGGATSANQVLEIAELTAILTKIIAAPATEAKQTEIKALLGALDSAAETDPTAEVGQIALLKGIIMQLQGDGAKANSFQLTGSTVTDEIIENQAEIFRSINILKTIGTASDETAIFGATWDKGESPTLTRTGAATGMIAGVGVDNQTVRNDFDGAPIFGEIEEAEDTLGNIFMRIPKFYIRKTKDAISGDYRSFEVSKTKHPGYYLPWLFWDFANEVELDHFDFGKHKGSYDGSNRLQSVPDVAPTSNQNIVQFRTAAMANNSVGDGRAGYQQLDIHAIDLLRMLMFIEFGTLNIQTLMAGYTEGYYGSAHVALEAETGVNRIRITDAQGVLYEVGQTISIHAAGATVSGLPSKAYGRIITAVDADVDSSGQTRITFDGAAIDIALNDYIMNTGFINGFSSQIAASSGSIISNITGKFPCMYRGIESPFGDTWAFVDGVNIAGSPVSHWAWVLNDAHYNGWGAGADGYRSNTFAHPYEQLNYRNSTGSDQYIKEMGFDPNHPFAEFPVVTAGGANDTKYYASNYWSNISDRIARFGGNWNAGVRAGLSPWHLHHASSNSYVHGGGRLLKKAL